MDFSEKELKALKQEYASGATDAQFDLWIETCKRRGLVPVEDIVLQIRSVKEWDETVKAKVFKKKVIFITTIRALLRLAERTGKYKGFTPIEWIYLSSSGNPDVVSTIPLPDPANVRNPRIPWACRGGAKRQGFDEPQYLVCRFEAYAQYYDDNGTKRLNQTWATRGPEQLGKCTKAAALREAFPEEVGDLYINEEFQNEPESAVQKSEPPQATTMIPPASPDVPQVDHTPAVGKEEPRPGEKKPESTTSSGSRKEEPSPSGSMPAPQEKTAPAAKEKTLAEATAEALKEGEEKKSSALEMKDVKKKAAAYIKRLGGSGSEGNKNLRRFILRCAGLDEGKDDTGKVSLKHWETIFILLETAKTDEALAKLVVKKPEEIRIEMERK